MDTSAEPRRIPIDELEQHRGAMLGPTSPVTLTQDRIDRFADVTCDRQWVHTDLERAAAGPFGAAIAHGFLTLALLSHVVDSLIVVPDAAGAINYGLDRVRFPSPVRAGSRVSATVEIRDVRRDAGRVLVTSRVTMTVVGESKPCCVADALTLYLPDGDGR